MNKGFVSLLRREFSGRVWQLWLFFLAAALLPTLVFRLSLRPRHEIPPRLRVSVSQDTFSLLPRSRQTADPPEHAAPSARLQSAAAAGNRLA